MSYNKLIINLSLAIFCVFIISAVFYGDRYIKMGPSLS